MPVGTAAKSLAADEGPSIRQKGKAPGGTGFSLTAAANRRAS